MKPKKISTHNIPVKNKARAFRFFHEVFDIPAREEADTTKYLILTQESLVFTAESTPITLDLHVKDHLETVKNHLASYYVPVISITDAPNNKVIITVNDFENNTINIFCNK